MKSLSYLCCKLIRREKGLRCWIELLSMRPLDSVRRVPSVLTLLRRKKEPRCPGLHPCSSWPSINCQSLRQGSTLYLKLVTEMPEWLWGWLWLSFSYLWLNHYLNDAAFTGFSIYNRFLTLPVTGNFSFALKSVMERLKQNEKKCIIISCIEN